MHAFASRRRCTQARSFSGTFRSRLTAARSTLRLGISASTLPAHISVLSFSFSFSSGFPPLFCVDYRPFRERSSTPFQLREGFTFFHCVGSWWSYNLFFQQSNWERFSLSLCCYQLHYTSIWQLDDATLADVHTQVRLLLKTGASALLFNLVWAVS
jgi:hypothetical protein